MAPLGSDPNGIILCLLTQNETTPLRHKYMLISSTMALVTKDKKWNSGLIFCKFVPE